MDRSEALNIPKKVGKISETPSMSSTLPVSPRTPSAAQIINAVPKDEIIQECVEALEYAGLDGQHRDLHFSVIEALIASGQVQGRERTLLEATSMRMKELSQFEPRDFIVMEDRADDKALASELKTYVTSVRRFIYHGTIYGRLSSIVESNLRPAEIPVWTHSEHLRRHCEGAVFFTTTWRGAIQWADVTHLKSRGRRDSQNRRPVIIRVRADELKVEKDPLAMARNCLLVRGDVSAKDADVFIAPLSGFPAWQPLQAYVRSPLRSK